MCNFAWWVNGFIILSIKAQCKRWYIFVIITVSEYWSECFRKSLLSSIRYNVQMVFLTTVIFVNEESSVSLCIWQNLLQHKRMCDIWRKRFWLKSRMWVLQHQDVKKLLPLFRVSDFLLPLPSYVDPYAFSKEFSWRVTTDTWTLVVLSASRCFLKYLPLLRNALSTKIMKL